MAVAANQSSLNPMRPPEPRAIISSPTVVGFELVGASASAKKRPLGKVRRRRPTLSSWHFKLRYVGDISNTTRLLES